MTELEKAYDHKKVEDKIYKRWMDSGYFNPDNLPDAKKREPFTISLPPPNVTGTLHMGHAFEDTIQDAIMRYQRMKGKRALWLPGTDHAAIATQAKFEKEHYKKTGKSRHDHSRKEFFKMIQDFALANQQGILSQLHKLGLSLDWSRLAFTLDKERELAVRTAFKAMYEAGLIYRDFRMVNWDPRGQTTVSDDEIEYVEQKDPFYYLQYGPFIIGTVRPETKFGDKYVVINPKDERYNKYKHGQKIDLEWINGPITATVIHDPDHDMEFGSGAMTITPWHDSHDFGLAQKFKLDAEQIIDDRGILLPVAGEFAGEHIKKARPKVVGKLQAKGLIKKIDKNYIHRVATNMRGGGVIEPQIKLQWFIDVNKEFILENSKISSIPSGSKTTLKDIMRKTVKSGQIKIMPERFEKIYFHWIDNLRDWCISRQIVYGHQIPAWYCGGPKKAALPKIGFADDIAPEVFAGKTRTYRLRDHGFKMGQRVAFENSQSKLLFGHAIITGVEQKSVGDIQLPDKLHSGKYKTTPELIAAFKHIHPQREVTKDTPAWIYTYKFESFTEEDEKAGCGQIITSMEIPAKCPACGGTNLTQDTDTLDTWFSSGLWTFSTLDWPDKTHDLKAFHPTSVMMPGYEILFFWVARMILMSGFLLGDIPFHKVALHGMVRDRQGRKFSKSLNNGVDPLEMTDKYGTDALRMALVFGSAPGNDLIFDEQKVKGMQHFANKLWNISRYVLSVIPEAASVARAIRDPVLNSRFRENNAFTQADRDILNKLHATIKSVTDNLEAFRLHEAAQTIYTFTWHEFADIYIEQSKEQLKDEKLKENTLVILFNCLIVTLKLLHPFMPFVTEEIWSRLKQKDLLIVADWPSPLDGSHQGK